MHIISFGSTAGMHASPLLSLCIIGGASAGFVSGGFERGPRSGIVVSNFSLSDGGFSLTHAFLGTFRQFRPCLMRLSNFATKLANVPYYPEEVQMSSD